MSAPKVQPETCSRCAKPMSRHDTAPRCPYNGWKNYETWAVHLWISNEQETYNEARDKARECLDEAPDHSNVPNIWTEQEAARFELADWLKEWVSDDVIAPILPGLGSDLLNAALSEVDWNEIADAFLDDLTTK